MSVQFDSLVLHVALRALGLVRRVQVATVADR